MCEDFVRRKKPLYDVISDPKLTTQCDICFYMREYGCALNGRNDKTSLVHEQVQPYRRRRR